MGTILKTRCSRRLQAMSWEDTRKSIRPCFNNWSNSQSINQSLRGDMGWLLILSPNEKLLILMLADQWLVTWTTKEAGVSPGWTRAMMKTTFTLTRNPELHNYSFLKTRSNFKRAEHSEHSFCKNLLYLWGKNHFHPLHQYPVSPFFKTIKIQTHVFNNQKKLVQPSWKRHLLLYLLKK